MIFIHEIDIKEKQYKEIITLNPYLALREALETAHDDNRFALIRSTGSYYDILKKENRDLSRQFKLIKNGEEQSVVIARASIDGDLRDFCNELYSDEWGCESTCCGYDRECARGYTVIVWFRQKPTTQEHIFCYDVFEEIRTLLEEKQWKDIASFKKSLMTIDKEVLKDFVEKLRR